MATTGCGPFLDAAAEAAGPELYLMLRRAVDYAIPSDGCDSGEHKFCIRCMAAELLARIDTAAAARERDAEPSEPGRWYFMDEHDPELRSAFLRLGAIPYNCEFSLMPTACKHPESGEVWQYMGTVCERFGAVHEFRHRMHPRFGLRCEARVSRSDHPRHFAHIIDAHGRTYS